MLKLLEYSEALPKLEKERYNQKVMEIKRNVNPYIDDSYNYGSVPVVSYMNIYDFLICSIEMGQYCDASLYRNT